MNGRYLLDTNIVIAIWAGDQVVLDQLANCENVYLSATVLGELFYGASRSSRVEENLAKIDDLISSVPVLPCDEGTSRVYGMIKQQLRISGRPIPENDIWIASIAQQHELTLISRDQHFDAVGNLSRDEW